MRPRPLSGYFFEDYSLGQTFVHATPRTITQGDTSLYQALTGSRNPLHCSEPFAQSLGYPTMPVDDLLVFHVAFGKTVPDISYNALANLGYAECRFVQPVFAADTLSAETEIIGLKQNSNGKTGVVYVRSNCFNQRNERVLTWVRWVMVHRRETITANIDLMPKGQTKFAASLPPEAMPAPKLPSVAACTLVNPGARMWDDYEVIDLAQTQQQPTELLLDKLPLASIAHPSGMTIDESDHTLATKLYQNTARVHFDLHHMQQSRFGRRLVYGGQVMSLCRALSYDGMENALSILAINSGSHHNPTFAGDTLYAVSIPIMKWQIDDNYGALRIKLLGYKNIDPNSPAFNIAKEEDLVLSLDYTVLIPRRS